MSWQEEIDHAVVPPQWQNEAARTRRVPVSLCVYTVLLSSRGRVTRCALNCTNIQHTM